MSSTDASKYKWLTDPAVCEVAVAGCLTVATGSDLERVVRSFGADPRHSVAREEVDLSDHDAVAARASGVGVVLVEDNGFAGSRSEVLKAASRRGKAASILWNVNGLALFSCASRGKVVCSLEVPNAEMDELPRSLRPLMRLADQETADPVAVGMLMVEHYTAMPVSTEHVRNLTAWYPIENPVVGLWVTPEELVGLKLPSVDIVELALSASSSRRWEVAERAAGEALAATTLADHPRLSSAIAQLGSVRPVILTPEADWCLSTIHSRQMAAGTQLAIAPSDDDAADALASLSYSGPRWAASQVLLYLCQPDDLTAVLGALNFAPSALPANAGAALLDWARQHLARPDE
jgi:hypothetical protein